MSIARKRLIGFEYEPTTAALCIANMILRGDGSTGVHWADAFLSHDHPQQVATVALTNPPFPHKKTDTPIEESVSRALHGLENRAKYALIVRPGLLAKKDRGNWRADIPKRNTLQAVCQLPDELFPPFSSARPVFNMPFRVAPAADGRANPSCERIWSAAATVRMVMLLLTAWLGQKVNGSARGRSILIGNWAITR